MDTSQEYILMCSQSDAARWTKETIMDDHNYFAGTPEKVIWLPRQDQLQEMLGSVSNVGRNWIFNLHRFIDFTQAQECNESRVGFAHSMEQLWLAHVMKEKFNKTWNGSDWI